MRTLPPGNVLFTLKSNPQPGGNSDTWPVVEIGPVAIVVNQRGEVPGLALVDASGHFERLDEVFRPAAAGASTARLEIYAVFADGMLAIAANGVVRVFAVPESDASGFVVSAGDSLPWAINSLEVTSFMVGEEPSDAARIQAAAKTYLEAQARASRPALSSSISVPDNPGGKAEAKEPKVRVVQQSTRVEAYSAPSVRHGRAFLLRQIADRNLGKQSKEPLP